MKEWAIVRRMTPKQKGEILERLGEGYELVKRTEYGILSGAGDKYILRRCSHCKYIEIWHLGHSWQPDVLKCDNCGECGEFSEVN